MAMFNVVKDSKEKTELFMKALETSFKKNHKVLEDVEKFVHDIPVVFQRQIVIEKVKDINSKKVELRTEVNVQPIQESEMFRACNTLDDGKIASKYFIANNGDKYTNEIVSLSLDNSIITDNSKEKTFASLNAIFKLITGNAYLKNKNSGLFLLVKQNGLSLASFDKSELIENMDIGDIAYSYKFLAITPAGLKSGSITVAAVEKYELTEEDGLVVTDCDRRDEILKCLEVLRTDENSRQDFGNSAVTANWTDDEKKSKYVRKPLGDKNRYMLLQKIESELAVVAVKKENHPEQ